MSKNTFTAALGVGTLILMCGCASIVKSEKTPVRFIGGLKSGDTQVNLPDGQYSLKNGQTTVLVSRSKTDIPISVTCNNETRDGVIQTKYDAVAGILGNIVFGGIIGMGIDSFNNKTYDPPATFNLSPLCMDSEKSNIAEDNSTGRSVSSLPE
ncbi:hypothetical protein EZJ49_08065 [Bdellovibrio bacteriovorus]|uniref:hypothetical protein n=1 Tax=Bdellovibrio bacteriovorus TaxID=959 RepID=UPI0021D3CC7E|nr:hypothetical protein [Bdellovibrio bacteriovorus]UXR66203.1 hypothetical protein EZJ49_08065 [Bdellovibrio bacteriovorus]